MGSSINLSDLFIHIPQTDAEFHRTCVADLLHRNNVNFPGAQPVSFARHHLQELQRRDYFVCEKTDGIRCLLYLHMLGELHETSEAQFLIDRKNEYYYVERDSLHLPTINGLESYHKGTILDGELVRQRFPNGRERLAYLIFDCLALDGENIMNRTFNVRIGKIDGLVAKPIKEFAKKYPQDVALQPFEVEMKKMEFPYGLEMMFKDRIPNLPHGNDGLIFTCLVTPYVAGTDQHILKWKPPHENTIDFRLLLGDFPTAEDEEGSYEDFQAKPPMELHVNHGSGRDGGYKFFATLTVTDAEWEAMKRLNQQLDGRIIECFRDPDVVDQDIWRPKLEPDGSPRFRDDKTDANHISVVNSVLDSIRDAVTEGDLIAAAPAIRIEFKARQAAEAKLKAAAKEEEQRRVREAEGRRRAGLERRESAAGKVEEEDDGPRYEQ